MKTAAAAFDDAAVAFGNATTALTANDVEVAAFAFGDAAVHLLLSHLMIEKLLQLHLVMLQLLLMRKLLYLVMLL